VNRTPRRAPPAHATPTLAVLLFAAAAPACTPCRIIGPLSHSEDERDHLLLRARAVGTNDDLIDRVDPPLTPSEKNLAAQEDSSCRSSYVWKNALTWTGSLLIAGAAGVTVGSAYATGNNDNTGKLIFGVSAGSLATLGSGLVAIGGILANGFSDRGCVTKMGP
jgi:hypothetical protein